jgi:hypothetical protein
MTAFSAYSETSFAESEVRLDANAFMTGASATSTAGNLDYDAKASITNPAATATFTAAAFGDVDAKATTNALTAVTASVSSGTAEGDGQGTASPTGVAAATASGTQTANGKANIVPPAATSIFTAGTLEYDAKANITLDAATADADLTVNDLADEDAQGTATVSGVSASGAANWDTVNGIYAVQVVFLATDFERSRTVNIVPYGNYKVYVTR